MELKDYVRGLTQMDRERLGHMAGYTGAYITNRIYKGSSVTMALAVAVDKMSNGAVDFRTLINKSDAVDWNYVKNALNQRPEIVFIDDTSES